ncbi:MAG: urease accessory protein UreE [Cyanobacteria bacterium P01_D01_bin.123]
MNAFTHRLPPDPQADVSDTLYLTAAERTRTRFRHQSPNGNPVHLQLSRGTVLRDGDLLRSNVGETLVRVVAKPEPVLTVTAARPLDLLRAAYHLGNRHVELEVHPAYLRLAPDPVLRSLLAEQLHVTVTEETAPFCPEMGAYHHAHA